METCTGQENKLISCNSKTHLYFGITHYDILFILEPASILARVTREFRNQKMKIVPKVGARGLTTGSRVGDGQISGPFPALCSLARNGLSGQNMDALYMGQSRIMYPKVPHMVL